MIDELTVKVSKVLWNEVSESNLKLREGVRRAAFLIQRHVNGDEQMGHDELQSAAIIMRELADAL